MRATLETCRVVFWSGLALVTPSAAQEWRRETVWFGRSGHAVAYDRDRQVHVMFGGTGLDGATAPLGTSEWDGRAWTQRKPAVSPSERTRHAMVFDEVRREVILFGGFLAGAALGDTWAWSGSSWRLLPTPVAPSARSGHRMVWDPVRRQAILFGGSNAAGWLGDTWSWNGSVWQQLLPAQSPTPRAVPGMAFDPLRGVLLLQGGGDAVTAFDDTWEWSGTTWTQVGAGFRRLFAQGMAFDPLLGAVVIHGGMIAFPQTDMWRWDPAASQWLRIVSQSLTAVDRRMDHVLDSHNGRLLLFGGTGTPAAGTSRYLMDVWGWDGSAWTRDWEESFPVRRGSADVVYDPLRQRTVLFGGYGNAMGTLGGSYFGDTWEWDGASWTQRQPPLSPPARQSGQSVWDGVARRMLVFGGAVEDATGFHVLADTWAWNGAGWQLLHTGAGTVPRFNGGMAFDTARNRAVLFGGQFTYPSITVQAATMEWDGSSWSRIQLAIEPPARMDTAMVYDPRGGRTVLFGGWTMIPPTMLGDTWEWDGTTWQQLQPVHAPPPRRGHRLSYDATRGRVLLFGGDQGPAGTGQSDAWAFDGTDWTQLGVPIRPAGRSFHGQVFDSVRDRLIAVSGMSGSAAVGYAPDQWELTTSALRAPAEAPLGAPLSFQVAGPAGGLFLLLLSGARVPGIPLLPNSVGQLRTLPLAADRLLGISLGFGLAGRLDAQGTGGVALGVPADPALAGLSFFTAGVLATPSGALDLTEDERVLLVR